MNEQIKKLRGRSRRVTNPDDARLREVLFSPSDASE